MKLPPKEAIFENWMKSQPQSVRSHWARMKNKAQSKAHMELNTIRYQFKPTSKYDGRGQLICNKPTLRQRLQDFAIGCVQKATR